MRLLFFILSVLFLNACATRQYGEMHRNYPHSKKINQEVNAALLDLEKGYTNLAQEKLALAYSQNPYSDVVLDGYGYYYENTGELDKANQYFTMALLYSPYSTFALKNYGAFLSRNGYSEQAKWYFNKANQLSKNPS